MQTQIISGCEASVCVFECPEYVNIQIVVAQLLPKLNVLKQHDNDMINVTQMLMVDMANVTGMVNAPFVTSFDGLCRLCHIYIL